MKPTKKRKKDARKAKTQKMRQDVRVLLNGLKTLQLTALKL